MFNYHPLVKILLVFIVCLGMAYLNYLLFNLNSLNFVYAVNSSYTLKLSLVAYFLVTLIFSDFYFRKKRYAVLTFWILLNAAFCVNFLTYQNGAAPPLFVQYTQSTSLLIYSALLISTKEPFPNWLRLFSFASIAVLIPCLIFYFSGNWFYYELTVYVLCFTPILKSFVFLRDYQRARPDVIDGD